MKLHKQTADIFVFDGGKERNALSRTTDLCIAAHQDDIEIMAFSPIAKCFNSPDLWFTGVVVSDGAGSPRTGIYSHLNDEQMKNLRKIEQKKAAFTGEYSAMLQLDYTSEEIKDKKDSRLTEDIVSIVSAAMPTVVYTHNLADKHDTHVATALRVIAALRSLPPENQPEKLYSMEVWRGLDWLCDQDKACFDTSMNPNLAEALLGVFDSQITGGKRYDNAALGRRLANATFFSSHSTDAFESLSYGMDITDIMKSDIDPGEYIKGYIKRFQEDVLNKIKRYL